MEYTYELLDFIVPENIYIGDTFPYEGDIDDAYDTTSKDRKYSEHKANECIKEVIRNTIGVVVDTVLYLVETDELLYPIEETQYCGVVVKIATDGSAAVQYISVRTKGPTLVGYNDIAEAAIKAKEELGSVDANVGIGMGQGAVGITTYVGTRKLRDDDWGKKMLKGNGTKWRVKAAEENDDEDQSELIELYKSETGKPFPLAIKNNPQKMTTLTTSFKTLDRTGKIAMVNAMHEIRGVPRYNVLMLNLLGEMIREVPLRTVDDIKEVGFDTEAAVRGNEDDVFAIQAISGWKQLGKNPNELKDEDGEPKSRREIENAITEYIRSKQQRSRKIEFDEKQEQVRDALSALGASKQEISDFIKNGYNRSLDLGTNINNALQQIGKKI